jgi:hypothetical protein
MRVNRQAAAGTVIAWLAVTLSSAGSAATCSLAGLGWMVADWTTRADINVHERWVSAPSGRLIGFALGPHRIHRGDDAVRLTSISFEQGKVVLRQRHFSGALVYGGESVDDPVTFAATSCGPASVTFEGIGRWAGGSVSYRRAGATLTVEGEVRDNGRPGHYVMVFTKE